MSGHGTIVGGMIVDSNQFDWAGNKERFNRLNEPDVSYHGVVFTETGLPPYILRARVVPLRNMGAAMTPMNSFLIMQGIETLGLRMDRICENTLAVAKHLKDHPQVEWVRYAGLDDSPHKALLDKYMGGRGSGVMRVSKAEPRLRLSLSMHCSSSPDSSTLAMPSHWPATRQARHTVSWRPRSWRVPESRKI